jgi:type IV fimbrial biogenesis protein FimT
MNTPHLPTSPARQAVRGFSLVELAIVLAIASILAGAALPSLGNLVRSVRMTTGTNDLFTSIVLARSEAAKRHARVALCKSDDGNSCAATGGWEQGWIVFHDANNNGRRDPGEKLVERVAGMHDALRISGNLNVAKYISYAPTGETKMSSGAFQAGTITVCNVSAKTQDARQIVLSAAGRPRTQRAKVAQCA